MEQFTVNQLKTIIHEMDLKHKIKTSVRKDNLIEQMENYLHFDGYEFHLKKNDEEKFLTPEILKKEKNVTKKPSKISHKLEPEQLLYPMPKKIKIKKIDFIPELQHTKIKIKKKDFIPELQEEPKEIIQTMKKPKKLELIKPKTLSQIIGKDLSIEEFNNLMDHYEKNYPEIYKRKLKDMNEYLKYEAKLKKSQPHIDPKYFNI